MQLSGQHAARVPRQRLLIVVTVVLGLALVAGGLVGLTPTTNAAPAVRNVRTGVWSDPATWSGGKLPLAGEPAAIVAGTTVTVAGSVQAAGVTVEAGGRLAFDPNASAELTSTRNIVVNGTLSMRPASGSVVQAIRFAGVDAARIVGGGMDPVDSDVGLWVMGAGQLDLAGTPKTGWTRAAGSVGAGATEVPLQTAPTGWQAGDDVSIAPTAKPDGGSDFYKGFDESAVAGTSSGSVRLATPTRRAHPQVNGQWGAEVMNLTRNVRIEGTVAGPAHVFIRSSRPQSIRYTQIRHVSVLKGSATGEGLSGRYGLHFHMMGEASRGTVVEGVVVRDAGSHTFVAHASHGITFRDDISYNNVRDAFWWDPSPNNREPGDPTNDTLIDGSIVARSLGVPDDNRDYRLSAFNLGMGRNNTIRNSTAVGTGGTAGSAGFGWPEDAGQNLPGNGVWTFNQGNVSHNNHDNGLFVWQNTDTLHDVSNFVSYHNGSYGIEHGAYINSYRYANAALYGNGKAGINTKAKPKPMRPLSFENLIVDGGGSSPHGLVSFDHVAEDDPLPTLFFCTVFKGQTGAAVGLSTGSEHRAPEIMDFVESQLSGTQFSMKSLLPGTRIRVQNGGSAFQLDAAGNRTTISPFVTVRGGCQPGPTTPPGLPGAPSPNPPPTPGPDPGPTPGPTTTQPGPSPTSTTRPPPQPTPTTAPPTTQPPGTTQPPPAPPPPPPTVQPRITAPASGATVSGIAMVTVTADGITGIRRVDLYVDGVREQADYRGPFLFAWPALTLPPGTHTLRAILIRANGSSLRSAPVTVETTGR